MSADDRLEAFLLRLLNLDDEAHNAAMNALEQDDAALYRAVVDAIQEAENERLFEPPREFHTDYSKLSTWSAGGFKLKSVIGKGQQAVVYVAEQSSVGRPVAVKVFQQPIALRPASVGILSKANLPRDGVPALIDTGTGLIGPNGEKLRTSWVAMTLVEGALLCGDGAKRRSRSDAVNILIGLGEIISWIHKRGIFHHDIKPGNVLVDERGQPWLIDFDLALHTDGGDGTISKAGTLIYMSPEKIRGDEGALPALADVYAFGATIYEVIADQPICSKSNLLQLVCSKTWCGYVEPIDALRGACDEDLIHVMKRALAAEPAARYPTVDHVVQDLQRCKEGARPWARRHVRPWHDLKFVVRRATPSRVLAVLFSLGLALLAVDGLQFRTAIISGWVALQDAAYESALGDAFSALAKHDYETAIDAFSSCLDRRPNERFAIFGMTRGLREQETAADSLSAAIDFLRRVRTDEEKTNRLVELLRARVRGPAPSEPPGLFDDPDRRWAALMHAASAYTPTEFVLCASAEERANIAQHLAEAWPRISWIRAGVNFDIPEASRSRGCEPDGCYRALTLHPLQFGLSRKGF